KVRLEVFRETRADAKEFIFRPAQIADPNFSVRIFVADHRDVSARLEAPVEFGRGQGREAEFNPLDGVGRGKFQAHGSPAPWASPPVIALMCLLPRLNATESSRSGARRSRVEIRLVSFEIDLLAWGAGGGTDVSGAVRVSFETSPSTAV